MHFRCFALLASFASFASSANTRTHRLTHTVTHTSVHTLKCPFVLQLQRTFLFWPQLIYASFLPPRLFSDFCHLTFAWLPAVAVAFRFLFERFENFNFEFLSSERTNVPLSPPPPLPLRSYHKKSAPQNGWRNGAALVNARCLLFTFNLIIVPFFLGLSLQKFSLVF